MPDSWLPPWLQPVADSVQSAADPFTDWLRSQQPANDVPPWQSRPIPPTNLDDITIEPPPNPLIDVSERAVEPAQPNPLVDSYRAEPPASPNPIVNSYRVEPSNTPPNPLVNSYQIESPRPNPLVAPYRKPDPGPPHYDFTDAEGADFTAYRPTDPNDIEIIPPFNAPVGYMPPPNASAPPGTPFDKPGEYVERDPQQTIEPDPMDTAGGFDAKVDEYRGDPELRLRARMDREAALEAMAAKSAKEQAEKEKADLERSIQIREQARAKALADRAQIEQDARSLADGTPFGNWWASRSTGQKVSNYIAAIFGGLMQGSTGGRNSAIDLMMKAADDDANQKWKSLQMRREMSGEDLNDADAEYKFKETARAASLQQMKNEVQARMAGFDLQGKAAQDAGAMLAALDAAQAEQRAKGIADAQKQWLEAYKADSERMQAEAQMKNALSLEAQRAAKAGGGGGGGGAGAAGSTAGWGPKDVHTGAQWADHYKITGAIKEPPPDGMNGKEFNDWFEKQKALGQMSTDVARNVSIQQGVDLDRRKLAITFDGAPLYEYTPDGKPVVDGNGEQVPLLAPTDTEGAQIRAEIANTVKAIRALYQIKAIRDRMSVGDSKLPWKDAAQQLTSLQADVIKNMKAGTQGMSSDEDMNKIAAAAGVKDAKSFLDQTAAIDQGIRNAINNLNTDLKHHYRYNGPAIDIPPPPSAAPMKNETADILSGKGDRDESFGQSVKRGAKELFSAHPQRLILSGGQSGKESKMSGEQKAQLAAAEAHLDTPNHPDQDMDAKGLAAAAVNGVEPAARAASAVALWKRVRAGNPAAVRAFHELSKDQVAAFMSLLPAKESWDATFGAATSGDPAALAKAAP